MRIAVHGMTRNGIKLLAEIDGRLCMLNYSAHSNVLKLDGDISMSDMKQLLANAWGFHIAPPLIVTGRSLDDVEVQLRMRIPVLRTALFRDEEAVRFGSPIAVEVLGKAIVVVARVNDEVCFLEPATWFPLIPAGAEVNNARPYIPLPVPVVVTVQHLSDMILHPVNEALRILPVPVR